MGNKTSTKDALPPPWYEGNETGYQLIREFDGMARTIHRDKNVLDRIHIRDWIRRDDEKGWLWVPYSAMMFDSDDIELIDARLRQQTGQTAATKDQWRDIVADAIRAGGRDEEALWMLCKRSTSALGSMRGYTSALENLAITIAKMVPIIEGGSFDLMVHQEYKDLLQAIALVKKEAETFSKREAQKVLKAIAEKPDGA